MTLTIHEDYEDLNLVHARVGRRIFERLHSLRGNAV